MADSSSESEESFDIENVHEDQREHVKEVLAKGKEIAPFYNVSLHSYFRTQCCIIYTRDITKPIKSSIIN